MKLTQIHSVVVAAAVVLASLLCPFGADARAFSDIEEFYNLSPKEQADIMDFYTIHDKSDSAMLCANIIANKYAEKERLSNIESLVYYSALELMGLAHLREFYNYQLAAKYLYKAKQVAQQYGHKWQYINTINLMAVLDATRNNLEKNYAYSLELIGYFKNSFSELHNYFLTVSKRHRNGAVTLNDCFGNLVYLAIKYDKIDEISNEVQQYQQLHVEHASNTSFAIVDCKMAVYYSKGQYEKALECNQPKFLDDREMIANDAIMRHAVNEVVKYYLLMKCNRVQEAEKQLLWLENEFKKQNRTFELLEVLNMLQLHYERQGNAAQARKYELLYFTTKDEFMGKCMLAKVGEAALDLKLEESNEQMRELNYKHRTQGMVLWGTVIIAVLVIAFLTMAFVNNRRTLKKDRLLYEKQIALLNQEKELRPAPATDSGAPAEKPAEDELTQADLDLMEKITAVMESSDEIFGEDFSRQRLAELVGSNSKYVSRAISASKRGSFYALLNEYRIKEACRRLMDREHYGSYTIESIGYGVGFRSRSNFNAVFKDIVGLTPSAFLKLCREGKNPAER